MNILLIGHEGYLGHGLLTYLSTKHKVIGWDKKENIFNLDASILAKENIELVINLSVMADRGSKPYQTDTPTENVNVMGAYHLARILKGSDITWIQFSTREVLGPVYGPEDVFQTPVGLRPKFLVDETQPYAPINFYGKSKIMAEFISESHPNSAVIRLTTGYTDFNHHGANWVLGLIRSIVKGDPVGLTRGGEQFRDPLHTDDLGSLIELIHQNKAFGEKYHAGGGEENLISLKEFVLIADSQIKINSVEGGDWGFAFNNKKANTLTGWNPKKSIREVIPVIVQNVRRGF